MLRGPSLPERPHLGLDPEMPGVERLSTLRQHFERMADVNCELDQRLRNADDRHAELVDEADQMKAHNGVLKMASYYTATAEGPTDDGVVIKRHGNSQEVLIEPAPNLNINDTEPGDRVAISDSFVVQAVLDGETDAQTQTMEVVESPTVTCDSIGGIDEQIRETREAIEQPLENPEMFTGAGIDPLPGVFLHGPSGTGRMMLAKAVTNETNTLSIEMAGSEPVQKFVGEGTRLIRDLFELAVEREPAVASIDETDAVVSKRMGSKTSGDAEAQRVMMQLPSETDGFDDRGDICIITVANRFGMPDEAIFRPSRLDCLIKVPKPAVEGYCHILDIYTRDINIVDDVDLDALTEEFDDCFGADITSLTTEARMFAIHDGWTEVMSAGSGVVCEKLSNVDESGTGPTSGFTDYQY